VSPDETSSATAPAAAEPETSQYAEEVPTTLSKDERRAKRWEETKTDFKWATALLFVLVLGLSAVAPLADGPFRRATTYEEDLPGMTQVIFSPEGLVVPFEILSVLLLAALIAGIALGSRDVGREPEDSAWRDRSAEANAPEGEA
jgi:hypothetical protein